MKPYVKRKLRKYRGWITNTMLNEALRKEEYLKRKCVKVWEFVNPEGNKYLLGKYGNDEDNIIVTLGCYHPLLHKFVPEDIQVKQKSESYTTN